MALPLVEREPTPDELERLRLILSTFQDGTGMMATKHGTLPGWRDFERATALAFGGKAQESKALFDVIIPDPLRSGENVGISCKMRRTLRDTQRLGRVNIEVSNSSGKFWDALTLEGINVSNHKISPSLVGKTILNLVGSWHEALNIINGGPINVDRSIYLVLLWDSNGNYQLYRFPLLFPDPQDLAWEHPTGGRRLVGRDDQGILFEWYGESGGQLKYYPFVSDATWVSDVFRLEPLPEGESEYSLINKAHTYFPTQWELCSDSTGLMRDQ